MADGDVTALGLRPGKPAEPNQPPVSVEAKFVERNQTDNKALGFDWYNRDLERERRMGLPIERSKVETTHYTNAGTLNKWSAVVSGVVNRAAAAGEEAVGRKSPSIVLPPVTADTWAGNAVVSTGSEIPRSNAAQTAVSTSEGSVLGTTLEPETLRRLQAARGEAEKEYSARERQLKQLQSLPREELRETLSRSASDATLTDLTSQLNLTEKNLASKSAIYGPANSDIDRLQAQVQDLTKKIDDRINGVVAGLQTQAEAAKTRVNSLNEAVENAQKNEGDQPTKSRAAVLAAEPQPEIQARDNAYSTFALNVSDVSFKLAGASLEKGVMPEPATVRSEEFINAFDYRDPEPPPGVPISFAWERTRYPFAHNRDLLRFSVKTAAAGRQRADHSRGVARSGHAAPAPGQTQRCDFRADCPLVGGRRSRPSGRPGGRSSEQPHPAGRHESRRRNGPGLPDRVASLPGQRRQSHRAPDRWRGQSR